MNNRVRFGLLGVSLMLVLSALAAAPNKKPANASEAIGAIGAKVVEFAKTHLGEQVGNGECWTLANEATKSAGAKSSGAYKDDPDNGDYVWGDLVATIEFKSGKRNEKSAPGLKVQPGDIVQFRDVKFAGKRPGGGTYSNTVPHHTAIVAAVGNAARREVTVLQQNFNGNRTVHEMTFFLGDLQEGFVRIYRPKP